MPATLLPAVAEALIKIQYLSLPDMTLPSPMMLFSAPESMRTPWWQLPCSWVPVEEALRMAREGEISNRLSALALLWCEPLPQR